LIRSLQGASGIIVHPEGYLKKVRELCTKHNIFMIADEVAVGFGKTGKMFTCEHEDVIPDILCLAKEVFQEVASLLRQQLHLKKYIKAFLQKLKSSKTFFHGHTYTAPPGVRCCNSKPGNLPRGKYNRKPSEKK